MDPGDQNLSLDDFMTWRVEALREFLTKRGLTKDGNKAELAALCYSAHVMNLPVVPTSSEVLRQNLLDYKSLLTVGDIIIPDPFKVYKNWLGEKFGIAQWPPIYLSDIIRYLADSSSAENIKSVLQDYKIGKAYEYFNNGFLHEVFLHLLDNNSPYCLLRATCTPSMRFSDDQHSLWICVEKVSGEIKSSYCTCTAGLGGTCNHVAALLFRIESANILGLSSCTSVPCTWKIPSRTRDIQPQMIKDMTIKKSRHGDLGKKRPLVSQVKKEFSPCPDGVKESENTSIFMNIVKKTLPNACVFKGAPSETILTPVPSEIITSDQEVTHSSEKRTVELDITKFYMKNMINSYTEPSAFLDAIPVLNDEEVNNIQILTTGQAQCNTWHDIRHCRITSSTFYSIYTKVKSSKTKPVDFSPNVANVMGYTQVNPNIKSLKHGREMEPIAKCSYKEHVSHSKHINVEIQECGVFLDKQHSYLAASPDLLVSCDCCGKGVVEIKCPMIRNCEICTNFCFCSMPDYLSLSSGTYALRKNHAYYGQIQGQLGITGRHYCDFFIYTCNGVFCQRIPFDSDFYTDMQNHLVYFFVNHVVPEMFSKSIKATSQSDCGSEDRQMNECMDFEINYFCPVCNHLVENNVTSYKGQSICCDNCGLWYHFRCVHVTKQMAAKLKTWSCQKCNL